MGEAATQGTGGNVLTVKNWHVLLVLVSWLVLAVMAFTNLRAQAEEEDRRIRDLEAKPTITYQQYADGQHNLEQRLERIERKLDAEQDAKQERRH